MDKKTTCGNVRNLRPHDNLEQLFQQESLDKSNHENLQQVFKETKSDKMQKLRWGKEF